MAPHPSQSIVGRKILLKGFEKKPNFGKKSFQISPGMARASNGPGGPGGPADPRSDRRLSPGDSTFEAGWESAIRCTLLLCDFVIEAATACPHSSRRGH